MFGTPSSGRLIYWTLPQVGGSFGRHAFKWEVPLVDAPVGGSFTEPAPKSEVLLLGTPFSGRFLL